jgi:hypothetical protein
MLTIKGDYICPHCARKMGLIPRQDYIQQTEIDCVICGEVHDCIYINDLTSENESINIEINRVITASG